MGCAHRQQTEYWTLFSDILQVNVTPMPFTRIRFLPDINRWSSLGERWVQAVPEPLDN